MTDAAATTIGPWLPMSSAPMDASWVDVLMADGSERRAHWACDLSGEEQPPFRGWFCSRVGGFAQIHDPVAWRPATAADPRDVARKTEPG